MDINTVAENLTELLTNSVNMTSVYYDLFFNTTPMDITLKQYNDNNELVEVTIPNRAKDKICKTGVGSPEGVVIANIGEGYVDTDAKAVYFKTADEGAATGWTILSSGGGGGTTDGANVDLSNLTSTGELKIGRMYTLPAASAFLANKVVQYIGESNGTLTRGYFYQCISTGGIYSWENIEVQNASTSANISLSNLSTIGEIRVGNMSSLPTPSASLDGSIIQYTGDTTSSLTNGYFYKCTQDESGTFVWQNVEVQETPTVYNLNYTIATIAPSTTNFVEGETYSVANSIQRTTNLFAGYKENYIDPIDEKIPAQATATNQLADKAFVNSSIAASAASFRGNWVNWAAVPTDSSLYPADLTGSRIPINNDYIVLQDASDYGSEYNGSWRFMYIGTWATDGKNGWNPSYRIGSAFTSEQQAAIDSGATSTLISQISTNATNIGNLETDKLDKVYTSGNKVYGTSSSGAQVTYTAGDNVSLNEVTSGSTTTYNISAVDKRVTQTVSTANNNYPILAKASTDTSTVTDTAVFSSAVKINPSTGNITATKFTGALTGDVTGNCSGSSGSCTGNAATATKATQDANGNVIIDTYQTKATAVTHTENTAAGSATQPVYINAAGVATAITSYSGNVTGNLTGNASTATKATQDASGNIITDTYQIISTAVTHTASTAVGSSTLPVYVDENGVATVITSYEGNAATATKATQDASGNNIINTYATKVGLTTKNQMSLSSPAIPLSNIIDMYYYNATEATTFTFDISALTIASGQVYTFELYLAMTTSVVTLTFPSNLSWLYGDAPDLTETGYYFFAFRTYDQGSTWIGNLQGEV